MVALVLCSAAQSAEVELWTVDSLTRVNQTGPAAASEGVGGEVRIEAARNEIEPFQVIATAAPDVLRGATVEFKGLRGPGGARIDSAEIFYEHYINVVTSSPKSPYPPGEHPDPLIPVVQGQPIFQPITKLPTEDRIRQPFWIDLHVSADAPAGAYSGEFTLIAANGERAAIPVHLTVWNFEIPSRPTLASLFGVEAPRVARVHGAQPGTPRGNRMIRAYEDLLADHKLTAEGFHGAMNVFDSDSERVSLINDSQPVIGTPRDVYRHYLDEKHLSTVVIPMWPEWPYPDALGKDRRKAQKYIAQHIQELRRRGWEQGVLGQCGYIDEPRTEKDYARVREWGQFYNEVEERFNVEIPMFVTEQPASEDEKWGSLDGYVDIWVTYVGDLWDDMHGHNTRKVAQRRAAGDQIWLYCGMTPMPRTWENQNGNPDVYREGNPPAWLIDFPPMNHRITTWIAPIYEATGVLYWATVDVRDGVDPWKRSDTFCLDDRYYYNGDGFFIYSGFEETVGFDGPIASMRLKWLRESFEDHAYITLLQQRGEGAFAMQQIRRIARNVGDWNDNSAELFAARHAMAERLSNPDS